MGNNERWTTAWKTSVFGDSVWHGELMRFLTSIGLFELPPRRGGRIRLGIDPVHPLFGPKSKTVHFLSG